MAGAGKSLDGRGPERPHMGSDGLFDLDQECWVVLAKYNLLLATVFGVLAVGARTALAGSELLVIENAALALLFGGVQTYAWLSS